MGQWLAPGGSVTSWLEQMLELKEPLGYHFGSDLSMRKIINSAAVNVTLGVLLPTQVNPKLSGDLSQMPQLNWQNSALLGMRRWYLDDSILYLSLS